MDNARRPYNEQKQSEPSADFIEAAISELSAAEAARIKASGGTESVEEISRQLAFNLRSQLPRLLQLFNLLDDNEHFQKLVELGCHGPTLLLHIGRVLDFPRRVTPKFEDLVSCGRWTTYLQRIADLAIDIQKLISKGGLELVPHDLGDGVNSLPPLLHQYALVLSHIREATDQKKANGPMGIDSAALAQLDTYVSKSTRARRTTLVLKLVDIASNHKYLITPRSYRRTVNRWIKNHPA